MIWFSWTIDNEKAIIDVINSFSRKVILIAGASCAGKTTFAKFLGQSLHDSYTLNMDNYFKDLDDPTLPNADKYLSFDQLESYHLDRIGSCVDDLLNGRKVPIPIYNLELNRRQGHRMVQLYDPGTIIVDGLFAFALNLPNHDVVKVFLEADGDERCARRVKRDRLYFPNASSNSIQRVFVGKVEPAYRDLVLPYRSEADIVIDTTKRR